MRLARAWHCFWLRLRRSAIGCGTRPRLPQRAPAMRVPRNTDGGASRESQPRASTSRPRYFRLAILPHTRCLPPPPAHSLSTPRAVRIGAPRCSIISYLPSLTILLPESANQQKTYFTTAPHITERARPCRPKSPFPSSTSLPPALWLVCRRSWSCTHWTSSKPECEPPHLRNGTGWRRPVLTPSQADPGQGPNPRSRPLHEHGGLLQQDYQERRVCERAICFEDSAWPELTRNQRVASLPWY